MAFSGTCARKMHAVEQYRSAVLNIPDAVFARSSGGHVERKARSSFIMVRMFAAVTKPRESSKARLYKRRSKLQAIKNQSQKPMALTVLSEVCEPFKISNNK